MGSFRQNENRGKCVMNNPRKILCAAIAAAAMMFAAGAHAQEVKHYRFAYDQPKTTGYGILGDIFSDKLKELSKGTMLISPVAGLEAPAPTARRGTGRSAWCLYSAPSACR